jgi:hypothetical protein
VDDLSFAEAWEAAEQPICRNVTHRTRIRCRRRLHGWDATAAWHQPDYDVRLNLLNVGNVQYFDALIPSDGGRSIPGIGRTLMATLDWKFRKG